MNTQDKSTVLIKRLLSLGYTPGQAARKLGCSRQHLYYVLIGDRKSDELLRRAFELPARTLRLRERGRKTA